MDGFLGQGWVGCWCSVAVAGGCLPSSCFICRTTLLCASLHRTVCFTVPYHSLSCAILWLSLPNHAPLSQLYLIPSLPVPPCSLLCVLLSPDLRFLTTPRHATSRPFIPTLHRPALAMLSLSRPHCSALFRPCLTRHVTPRHARFFPSCSAPRCCALSFLCNAPPCSALSYPTPHATPCHSPLYHAPSHPTISL